MALQAVLNRLPVPTEIRQQIATNVAPVAPVRINPLVHTQSNPHDPPGNGKCPLMTLPTELRRDIFSYILPKTKIYYPAASKKHTNTVRNVLVLNKQICGELLVSLYEERTFVVNVYEGVFNGGIEFLNSGIQRLQYKEHFAQVRFKRFERADDPCGFSRIKNLILQIHPTSESAQITTRHNSIYTHFMLRALVKLLRKFNGSFSLNYLEIRFAQNIPPGIQHPWKVPPPFNTPRCTSIHGISNIQVILQPLLSLRRLQTLKLQLPHGLESDQGLRNFTEKLMVVCKGNENFKEVDDDFNHRIECARDMLEDWLQAFKFGNKGREIQGLTEADFLNVVDQAEIDEDGYFDMPAEMPDLDPHDSAYGGNHPSSTPPVDKGKGKARDLPLRNYRPTDSQTSPDHKRRKTMLAASSDVDNGDFDGVDDDSTNTISGFDRGPRTAQRVRLFRLKKARMERLVRDAADGIVTTQAALAQVRDSATQAPHTAPTTQTFYPPQTLNTQNTGTQGSLNQVNTAQPPHTAPPIHFPHPVDNPADYDYVDPEDSREITGLQSYSAPTTASRMDFAAAPCPAPLTAPPRQGFFSIPSRSYFSVPVSAVAPVAPVAPMAHMIPGGSMAQTAQNQHRSDIGQPEEEMVMQAIDMSLASTNYGIAIGARRNNAASNRMTTESTTTSRNDSVVTSPSNDATIPNHSNDTRPTHSNITILNHNNLRNFNYGFISEQDEAEELASIAAEQGSVIDDDDDDDDDDWGANYSFHDDIDDEDEDVFEYE